MKCLLKILGTVMFCLGCLLPSTYQVSAQVPRDAVLNDADDVFSRPEFQRFKNQKPSGRKNPFASPSGGPGSGGNSGEGSTGEDGQADEGEGGSNTEESGESEEDRLSRPQSRQSSDSNSSFFGGGSFGDFGAGMAGLFKILGIVALAFMVGMILWLVIPALLNQERKLEETTKRDLLASLEEGASGLQQDRRSLDDYLAHARNMADKKQYREAVAYVLLAAMAEMIARGLVTHRVGLTHRDYYRAIRRHPELGREYLKILKIYEPLAFGRRVAELSHYEHACDALEAGFRETQTIS